MGLGTGTTVYLLMFIMSFVIYLGTPAHHSTLFMDALTGNFDYLTLNASLLLNLSVAAITGVFVFAITRDAIQSFVVGIIGFLSTFIVIPLGVLSDAALPASFKALLLGIFGLLYVMAMFSFVRGTGGTP